MTTLSIPDMTCGHCKATVESTLGALGDAGQISVDLASRTATATGPASPDRLIRALDEVGFPATAIG
ncbi:heavy-metal-associated domain-containing protein [Rhodobacter sp. HX-7-19]|uniref:Heavy-metal-associated domain-containing protein n=1 Tax=Paragemmobacter kunshanensis TaxID=2583234 RepID=A0A6M1TUB7_9RHOB|nr:heavy-metal-associated domain-containing protein [Rhodobacter kunshanensis]NGQ91928.1 heavy-metal-associated domain-containing protein [Rhodobacter kunshanensis]